MLKRAGIMCAALALTALSGCGAGNAVMSAEPYTDSAQMREFLSGELGLELPENGEIRVEHELVMTYTDDGIPESISGLSDEFYEIEYTLDMDAEGPLAPLAMDGMAWLAEQGGVRFYFGLAEGSAELNGSEYELGAIVFHAYSGDTMGAMFSMGLSGSQTERFSAAVTGNGQPISSLVPRYIISLAGDAVGLDGLF